MDIALTEADELILDYTASSDADTVINLTNHSYFNLSGKEQILDQELYLNADSYLEVDAGLIPTGKLIDVSGTDFDFRKRRAIRSGKYDHCFVLNPNGIQAEAWDPGSGRGMRMVTDQPAVQLYCGAGLGGTKGKGGRIYKPFAGFCLETQHFPDSPNHDSFPSTILRARSTRPFSDRYISMYRVEKMPVVGPHPFSSMDATGRRSAAGIWSAGTSPR